MSASPTGQPGSTPGDTARSSIYVLVLVVEVAVIASLYWLGRYFG